jgi:sugar phosphate isomerase/epimerase
MRRLQMGMWRKFDEQHWQNYSSELISGLEISLYDDYAALRELKQQCERRGLTFGVHGPIFNHQGYTLPKVTSMHREEREQAFASIEKEVEAAAEIGADYLLFHYPFLPLFPQSPFKHFDKLPSPNMRYDSYQIKREEFRAYSEEMFRRLASLQVRYGQRIVLEHDFFGDYGDIFIEMFQKFPEIMLVVDTGRLDLSARITEGFNPYPWLESIAPHVYLVHYSNVFYEHSTFTHHLPVIPDHDHDANYGDAHAYLAFLAKRNDKFHVTFEHQAHWVSRHTLQKLYRRTAALLQ